MTEPTSTQPKHTHYVSLENGCIHPAMTSPAGYEDEHTTEWRPATAAEIKRYKEGAAGSDRTEAYASLSEPLTSAQAAQVTPTTITLANDDNDGVQIQPPAPPAERTPAPPPPAPLNTTKG